MRNFQIRKILAFMVMAALLLPVPGDADEFAVKEEIRQVVDGKLAIDNRFDGDTVRQIQMMMLALKDGSEKPLVRLTELKPGVYNYGMRSAVERVQKYFLPDKTVNLGVVDADTAKMIIAYALIQDNDFAWSMVDDAIDWGDIEKGTVVFDPHAADLYPAEMVTELQNLLLKAKDAAGAPLVLKSQLEPGQYNQVMADAIARFQEINLGRAKGSLSGVLDASTLAKLRNPAAPVAAVAAQAEAPQAEVEAPAVKAQAETPKTAEPPKAELAKVAEMPKAAPSLSDMMAKMMAGAPKPDAVKAAEVQKPAVAEDPFAKAAAEEAQKAEAAKLAEAKKLEDAKLAAAEAKLAEAKKAEEAKLAEAQKAEAAKLTTAKAVETAPLAETPKAAPPAPSLADMMAKMMGAPKPEGVVPAAALVDAKKTVTEADPIALALAQDARLVEAQKVEAVKQAEAKKAEEARLAAEAKKAEEARLAIAAAAEQAKLAEAQKATAAAAKLAETKKAEEARITAAKEAMARMAAVSKAAEEAKLAEAKQAEEAKLATAKLAEEAKLAEATQKAEESKLQAATLKAAKKDTATSAEAESALLGLAAQSSQQTIALENEREPKLALNLAAPPSSEKPAAAMTDAQGVVLAPPKEVPLTVMEALPPVQVQAAPKKEAVIVEVPAPEIGQSVSAVRGGLKNVFWLMGWTVQLLLSTLAFFFTLPGVIVLLIVGLIYRLSRLPKFFPRSSLVVGQTPHMLRPRQFLWGSQLPVTLKRDGGLGLGGFGRVVSYVYPGKYGECRVKPKGECVVSINGFPIVPGGPLASVRLVNKDQVEVHLGTESFGPLQFQGS